METAWFDFFVKRSTEAKQLVTSNALKELKQNDWEDLAWGVFWIVAL